MEAACGGCGGPLRAFSRESARGLFCRSCFEDWLIMDPIPEISCRAEFYDGEPMERPVCNWYDKFLSIDGIPLRLVLSDCLFTLDAGEPEHADGEIVKQIKDFPNVWMVWKVIIGDEHVSGSVRCQEPEFHRLWAPPFIHAIVSSFGKAYIWYGTDFNVPDRVRTVSKCKKIVCMDRETLLVLTTDGVVRKTALNLGRVDPLYVIRGVRDIVSHAYLEVVIYLMEDGMVTVFSVPETKKKTGSSMTEVCARKLSFFPVESIMYMRLKTNILSVVYHETYGFFTVDVSGRVDVFGPSLDYANATVLDGVLRDMNSHPAGIARVIPCVQNTHGPEDSILALRRDKSVFFWSSVERRFANGVEFATVAPRLGGDVEDVISCGEDDGSMFVARKSDGTHVVWGLLHKIGTRACRREEIRDVVSVVSSRGNGCEQYGCLFLQNDGLVYEYKMTLDATDEDDDGVPPPLRGAPLDPYRDHESMGLIADSVIHMATVPGLREDGIMTVYDHSGLCASAHEREYEILIAGSAFPLHVKVRFDLRDHLVGFPGYPRRIIVTPAVYFESGISVGSGTPSMPGTAPMPAMPAAPSSPMVPATPSPVQPTQDGGGGFHPPAASPWSPTDPLPPGWREPMTRASPMTPTPSPVWNTCIILCTKDGGEVWIPFKYIDPRNPRYFDIQTLGWRPEPTEAKQCAVCFRARDGTVPVHPNQQACPCARDGRCMGKCVVTRFYPSKGTRAWGVEYAVLLEVSIQLLHVFESTPVVQTTCSESVRTQARDLIAEFFVPRGARRGLFM
jgi:hypothetical protein